MNIRQNCYPRLLSFGKCYWILHSLLYHKDSDSICQILGVYYHGNGTFCNKRRIL